MKRYYLVERPGDFEPDQFEISGTESVEEDMREIFSTGAVTKITQTNYNGEIIKVLYDYSLSMRNGGMKFVFTKNK